MGMDTCGVVLCPQCGNKHVTELDESRLRSASSRLYSAKDAISEAGGLLEDAGQKSLWAELGNVHTSLMAVIKKRLCGIDRNDS